MLQLGRLDLVASGLGESSRLGVVGLSGLYTQQVAWVGTRQGCLTRRTWRFGRRFRTRTDGHTCPSVLFRWTSACKKFFTIFFFTIGNFSEVDVSNLNPRWRRARADARGRAQTGEDARRQVRVGADG